MQTQIPAQQAQQNQSRTEHKSQESAQPQFEDSRPEATAQLRLQSLMANGVQSTQLKSMQAMMASSTPARNLGQSPSVRNVVPVQRMEDEEPLQAKADEPVQREQAETQSPKPNNTGLPDNLKAGIENLSGMSMDHVHVHYNSDKPAQLQAHAYAQGSEIHVAPGQEKHLPHEAWHVVQQAQGRVKPTMQMKDAVPVNDDAGLEHEADVMGAKALQMTRPAVAVQNKNSSTTAKLSSRIGDVTQHLLMQRKVIQLKPLTIEEKAQLNEYFILVNTMYDSLSCSKFLPPLLGDKFYQDAAVAMDLVGECLVKNESFGPKAMSVIEWRMEELIKRWDVARFEAAKLGGLPMELNQSQLTHAFLKEFRIWLGEKNGGTYSTKTYNTGVSGPTSNGKTVRGITTTKEAFDGMRKSVAQTLDDNGCMVFNVSLSFGEGFEATDFIIVEKSNPTGSREKPKLTFHVWGKYM
jgi:hypothetical protein